MSTSWIPQIRHADKRGTLRLTTMTDLTRQRSPQTTLSGVHPSYSTHTTLGVGGRLQAFGLKGRARTPSTRRPGERAVASRRRAVRERGVGGCRMTSLLEEERYSSSRRDVIRHPPLRGFLFFLFFFKNFIFKKIKLKKIKKLFFYFKN